MKPAPNFIADWAREQRKPTWSNVEDAAAAAQARGIALTASDLKQAEASGKITGPKRPLFEAFFGPIPNEPPAQPPDELVVAIREQAIAIRENTAAVRELLTWLQPLALRGLGLASEEAEARLRLAAESLAGQHPQLP